MERKTKKPKKKLQEWTNHNGGGTATREVSKKEHDQHVKWNIERAARIEREKKEARTNAIGQFMSELTQEERTKMMASKSLQTQAALTPVERAVRIKYVLDKFKAGWSGTEIVAAYQQDFDCGKRHADYWRNEAMKALAEYTLKDAESLKNIQLMRLEGILREALEQHDYKAANGILETINKLCNLYKKDDAPATQTITEFHFGGDSGNGLRDNVISVIQNYTGEVPEVVEDE